MTPSAELLTMHQEEEAEYLRPLPQLSDESLDLLEANEKLGLPIFAADEQRIADQIDACCRAIRVSRPRDPSTVTMAGKVC